MNNRSGFSFLEVVIALGISLSIIGILVQFTGMVAKVQGSLNAILAANKDVNGVLGAITSELRSATQSAAGGFPVESASTSSIVFYTDTDGDGIIERVRYFISSSTLQKGIIDPTGTPAMYPTSTERIATVLSNVGAGSGFSFYDQNYTGTQPALVAPVDPTAVSIVNFTLVETGRSFSTTAMLRNLKNN